MANNYYNFTPVFIPGTKVRSDAVNTQYSAIETAFGLLPTDTGSMALGTSTWAGTSAGTANAYEVTMPDTRLANSDGEEVVFRADKTNTGAATLNVDGIGALPLVRADDSAVIAGDITTDLLYIARYDANHTHFQLVVPTASYLAAATAAAIAAAASAAAAGVSETNAATSETNAGVSETNALASENKANQWAEEPEDSPVEPGEFSAFHWAQKAQGFSGLPTGSSLGDLIEWDGLGGYQISTKLDWVGTGYRMQGADPGVPGVGDTLTALFQFESTDDNLYGQIGWDNNIDFHIRNYAAGGGYLITGRNTGNTATNTILDADPDGAINLYNAGALTVEVRSDGVALRGSVASAPSGGANQDTYVLLENSGGTDIGYVGFIATPTLRVRNQVHGGGVALQSEDSAGVLQDLLVGDPDGATNLYFDGLSMLGTTANGAYLRSSSAGDPTVPDAIASRIQFRSSDDNEYGRIGFLTGIDLKVRSLTHGGNILLEGEDSVGVQNTLADFDPDAGASIYYDGGLRFITNTVGVGVRSLSAADPTVPNNMTITQMRFESSDGNDYATLGYKGGSSDFFISSKAHGSNVNIEAENAAGTPTTIMLANPDGATLIYREGDYKLGTQGNGITVFGVTDTDPTTGTTQDQQVLFQNRSFAATGYVGFPTTGSTALQIRNQVHGGTVQLRGEQTAGTVVTLFQGDPDGSANLYYAGTLRLSTGASGNVDVRADTSPGVSAAQGVNIALTQADGVEVGKWGHEASTTMIFRNKVHGGNLSIQGETAVGGVNTMFLGDPGGVSQVYYNGTAKVFTAATGIDIRGSLGNDPTLGGAQDALYELSNSSGTRLGSLGFGGVNDNLTINNRSHGGAVVLQGEDGAGASQTLVAGFAGAGAFLYYDGVHKLDTRLDGVGIRGSLNAALGGTQDTYIMLETSTGVDIGSVGFISSSTMGVSSFNHGGNIIIQAENAAGSNRSLFLGDPDGAVTLYHAGAAVFETGVGRVYVDGDATDSRLILRINGVDSAVQMLASATDFRIRSLTDGATITIEGEDAGATLRTGILFDPDDDVKLYDIGVEVARTLPAASGGWEVNNTSTGGGFERVLTESDKVVSTSYNTSDVTVNNSVTLVDVFSGIALEASSDYAIDGYMLVAQSSAAAGFRFRPDYSGTLTGGSNAVSVVSNDGTTFQEINVAISGTTTTITSATTNNLLVRVKGVIRTNAAGTLKFQFAQSVATAAGTTARQGCWLKCTKMS